MEPLAVSHGGGYRTVAGIVPRWALRSLRIYRVPGEHWYKPQTLPLIQMPCVLVKRLQDEQREISACSPAIVVPRHIPHPKTASKPGPMHLELGLAAHGALDEYVFLPMNLRGILRRSSKVVGDRRRIASELEADANGGDARPQ